MSDADWLQAFADQLVVMEIGDDFTVFGTLSHVGPQHLELRDADLHNQRDANSTREVYAIETRSIGVRVNHRHLSVPRSRVITIARLEDIEA